MQNNFFVVRSFNLFFRHKPAKIVVLFFLSLFLGFNQGVTIVLLIPLLGLLDPSQHTLAQNKWIEFLTTILHKIGLSVSLELVLAIFAVSLLSIAFLTYYQSILQAAYQQEFSHEIRRRLFKKIISSNWAFLNRKSKHNHIQILTTEIPKMTVYYYYYLGLFTKFIFILAHILLALMISVKFTLFVAGMGLVIFVLLRNYLTNARKIGNANIQVFTKMLKHIDDFWITVKMAKVHNSEEFYYNKFEESNKQMLEYQYKQIKNRAVPQLLFTLVGVFSLILVVYLAYNVARLPLTSLFVLIILFARIFPQFMGVNSDLNMMLSNVESVKMVLNLDMEIDEMKFENKNTTEQVTFDLSINIKNLNFAYNPNNPIFTNFSTSIPAYQTTGIIGPSGCGKTTLIDIISGLQKTQNGTIYVDDKVINTSQLSAWRSKLGYLPQDSFFIDGTIRENLIWDAESDISDSEIMEILKQVNIDKLVCSQVKGLDTSITNFQYHFSGGERQRLALARVLIRKPKLLLLDEATSALDSENEAQIMDCLMKLKSKVTILFVTHRENLKPYFDKIIDLSYK